VLKSNRSALLICHVDIQQKESYYRVVPPSERIEILQGTLSLMILRSLEIMGPLNGYAVARRIEQTAGQMISMNQGTIYPALLRLEQRGWITSDVGRSDNNRKARIYRITRLGKRQLRTEEENWDTISLIMRRFLRTGEGS
jgi:PadR family transcriptional regulator, regulatory protein PadR